MKIQRQRTTPNRSEQKLTAADKNLPQLTTLNRSRQKSAAAEQDQQRRTDDSFREQNFLGASRH
jgi:hypothetical protein